VLDLKLFVFNILYEAHNAQFAIWFTLKFIRLFCTQSYLSHFNIFVKINFTGPKKEDSQNISMSTKLRTERKLTPVSNKQRRYTMVPENIQKETAAFRRRFSLVPSRKLENEKTVSEDSEESDDTLVENSELNRTYLNQTVSLDDDIAVDTNCSTLENALVKRSQAKG